MGGERQQGLGLQFFFSFLFPAPIKHDDSELQVSELHLRSGSGATPWRKIYTHEIVSELTFARSSLVK